MQKKQISRLILKLSRYRFNNFDFKKLDAKLDKDTKKENEFNSTQNQNFDFMKKQKKTFNNVER